MKEEDKRAVALNSLTSIGKEYVTLSDSTTIGKDVLKDLKKLMELELREKYKVNKTKWRVITDPKPDPNKNQDGDKPPLSAAYDVIKEDKSDKKFITELKNKFDENNNKKKEKIYKIKELINDNKTDTDKYKRVQKELKELEKYFVIDMVPDIPISFNTIVELRNKKAIVFDGEEKNEKAAYCVPYIELNKDSKEIAAILNDKKELDKIFREKQFKSFDDMVILDFYNEITKKLSDTKDYLRKNDPDIREDIIDDLYKKLFALYDIKEYYFKNKETDKKEIKEKYIKEKIRKNNNLSIGGGDYTDVNDELVGGALGISKKLYDSLEAKSDDNMVNKVGKHLVKKFAPVVAVPVESAINVGIGALKSATEAAGKTAVGTYKGVRAAAKAVDKLTDIPSDVGKYVVEEVKKRERSNKQKAEEFSEADKFFHIVSNLKDKSTDEIDDVLNIKTLKELSDVLNEKSIYKKSIEELINIHDSLLSSNRDTLLKEQEKEASEYVIKKKEALGEFVLKAVDKYKKLKKSFVDKVNKDIDDIEKMLEEEASGNFVDDITFETIVDNNSGTYIKKLKNLNNYLNMLNKKNKKIGGAAPIFAVQKLKKDDGEQEVSENTPFDYYKKLKDIYIEIVNQYYKLVDEVGEEEKHYNFLYVYDYLNNPIISESDQSKSGTKEKLKEAYNFILDKINNLQPNDKLFVNDADGSITKKLKKHLMDDYQKPNEKNTLILKNEINNNLHKHKEQIIRWHPYGNNLKIYKYFNFLDKSLNLIEKCYDPTNDSIIESRCQNILEKLTKIFNDTVKSSGDNENKLNELNAKIQLIENRIKLLEELIQKLPRELEKLYKIIKSMKGLPQATEYEDHILNILKVHKIEFFEKDKDKHPIIKALNNEKIKREEQLKKIKSKREEAKKAIEDENAIKKATKNNQAPILIDRAYHSETKKDSETKKGGSGDITDEDYKKDLELDNTYLKDKLYLNFNKLIQKSDNESSTYNLDKFMRELKKDVEYLENNDDANQNSTKLQDIGRDRGIYEDIWHDYNLAVNKKDNKEEKWKNYLLYLTEGEKVHDRVIQNNLDPEIVLKLTFRDKAIYIFLMFLIRTINIIALEFLIEYNLIKSLQYTIMLYGFMYLFIISLLVILVNYDSYKLRILFNYLNFHINSSNLILQNVLFIIFIILVYILVKSDDFLKYFGDIFDFTNIYNNIYKFNESLNEDSDINLTQNEKLKLLYRIDIISMIIFIFSAFLVLIL